MTTIIWQPGCPVLPDNSDAGLRGGTNSVHYTLRVRGADSNAPVIMTSASGRELRLSETRNFNTPSSTNPDLLFEDTVAGPPTVRVRRLGSTLQTGVSYIEIGGDSDPDPHLYFERNNATNQSQVVPGPSNTSGLDVPLNSLSNPAAALAFVVEFNQAVSPAAANITDARIRVEYLLPPFGSGGPAPINRVWTAIETRVSLIENCSDTGAKIRLEPVGILPPSSQLRVAVLPGFQGITGLMDGTTLPQNLFAVVDTDPLDHSPLPNPFVGADELLEEFNVGGPGLDSLEDTQAKLITPTALWGGGELSSSLNFSGSGGVGGQFDWVIKQKPELFDTSLQTIQGGPNGELKFEQFTVGGIVDVHDFIIEAGAELQVRGPNPFVVNATGEIRIEGTLNINGGAARDVATLNTGSQPEPGGTGNCGGGDGGTASEVRANSTPRGGAGFSPFGGGKAGGIGGEAGYAQAGLPPSAAPNSRRPGGGGGGKLARNQSDLTATGVPGPEPSFGMEAGAGVHGNNNAFGGVTRVRPAPGGDSGVGPFVDGDDTNDFLGLHADTQVAILMDGTAPVLQSVGSIITGELSTIQAGYGGGAGGDAAPGPIFPTPNWTVKTDEKGGGGGGGAGAIRLRALGAIRFVGVESSLLCRGGRGATGENSIFLDRIGGSGGSGSGGHVILESATNISFELPPLSDRLPADRRRVFIDARGVQGRIGGLDNGNGVTLPVGESHGGHGGPGIIQLHVPNATAPPHEDSSLSDLVLPEGTIQELNAGDDNALLEVMRPAGIQMLPAFGVLSGAQSEWVDVRGAGLNPDGSQNLISFLFKGVDTATGFVQTTNGRVTEFSPIVQGALSPAEGSFQGDNDLMLTTAALQPLITSTAPISNDIYLRSPTLLRNFILRMTPTIGVSLDFIVQSAVYDSVAQTMLLTVAPHRG